MSIALLVVGIGLLTVGADQVVRGAQGLSTRFRISPVIVGLTVVALATSLPEALVSVGGVWQGKGDLALSNAIGSNLFNILFILGLVAVVRPVAVERGFLDRELPVLALVTGGCLVFTVDSHLSRNEGFLLVLALGMYLHALVRAQRRARIASPPPRNLPSASTSSGGSRPALRLAAGFLFLGVGAHLALQAAVGIAASLGASERVIGLFVLGAGSSLPELVTSYVAVRRNSSELAIGNVLGSCLFNLLFVVGLASSVAPASVFVSSAIQLDLALMAGAFVVSSLFLRSGLRLSRLEGVVLVANYFIYVAVALFIGHSTST